MKKICIAILSLALCTFILCACGTSSVFAPLIGAEEVVEKSAEPETACGLPLKLHEDGTFKIIQMTDFHEWLGIEGAFYSVEFKDDLKPLLKEYINQVLDTEKPDLVVLTGDNNFCLSALGDILKSVSLSTYEAIANVFEAREQYWTLTFGNHDAEGLPDKPDFMKVLSKYKYFVGGSTDGEYYNSFTYSTKDADGLTDDRYANFSIPIYDCEGESVAYNVFLLDCGSYNSVQHKDYRYILPEQIAWYESEAARLKSENGGVTVPSVLFTHIPLLEFYDAYLSDNRSIGYWAGISPSSTNGGLMAAMLEIGDVRAIFTGHNHYNSFTGFYTDGGKKIMVGVTPQCAAMSYDDTETTLRCRSITLYKSGNLKTSILTSATVKYPDGIEYGESLTYNLPLKPIITFPQIPVRPIKPLIPLQ